jgi:hypothetical protein
MRPRGTALNNVVSWERLRGSVGEPIPTEPQREGPKPDRRPHSPTIRLWNRLGPTVRRFLLTRSAPADEVQVSGPVLDPAEPVTINDFGAPQAALAAPLASLEMGGRWRRIPLSQRPRGCLMQTSEPSCRFAMPAASENRQVRAGILATPTPGCSEGVLIMHRSRLLQYQ